MYIATVPNRNSPPAILLRAGYREGGKVKSKTLANLSKWPRQKIAALRLLLKGETLAPLSRIFEIAASRRRTRARKALAAIKRLAFERSLAPAPSRERRLILDLVIALVLAPERGGGTTSLSDLQGVNPVDESELDHALSWLERGQERIEKSLAARHLEEGGLAFLDLRYGILSDGHGRPVSIAVQTDGEGAPKTLWPQLLKMKERLGLGTVALVPDRGAVSEDIHNQAKTSDGFDWIAPLNTAAIRKLVVDRTLTPDLFKPRGIREFSHPDFPGESLTAWRDEKIRGLRASARRSALGATRRALAKLQEFAGRGSVAGTQAIGASADAILDKHKTARFFVLDIAEKELSFRVNEESEAVEAALDGLCVLRASLAARRLSAEDLMGGYRNLIRLRKAFRSAKTLNVRALPRSSPREQVVRGNSFLRLLVCYVERGLARD
jgi:hypothetical protein